MQNQLRILIGVLFLVSTAPATAIDFNFTFTNGQIGTGGTVTGIVHGLTDNFTSAAQSVEVTSNTDGFGIGEYIGNPSFNTWTVGSGEVTFFDFLVLGGG